MTMMMTTTATTTDPEATMMMTTAYTLRNGPTKRGSLQLLLYDLHMRYAEKVVTQLLQEEEDFIPKRKSSGRMRNLLSRWC
jgi:hypothetical protein